MSTENPKELENPLEADIAAYDAAFPKLSGEAGKYVVFFQGKQIGLFETQPEAFQKGYELAGDRPFLVRQITAIPIVQHFSRAIDFRCLTSH